MSETAILAAAEAAAPIVKQVMTISAKDFLAMPKESRPKVLREKEVTVDLNEDTQMLVHVRQLTKAQTALLNKRVIDTMPEVPLVEQVYATMHTDKLTNQPRRPGTYKESNPDDPKYKQQLEVWFNEACVWLGLISASEDFGVDAFNLDDKFTEIGELLPSPALLRLAIEAAKVNEGLNLADQLMQQVQTNEAILEQLRALDELQFAAEKLNAEAEEAVTAPEPVVEEIPAPEAEIVEA
jgi:hypothetical protein